MPRHTFLVSLAAALVAALCPGSPLWAAHGELIPETTAAQHGLTRPWFTQVQLDPSQGRLSNLVLYKGALYAQTDKAVVHAIDAETGKTLWWKQVGRPLYPTMTPGVGHDFLAFVNGSRLYVLNRYNGDILLEQNLSGSPAGGPAVSAKRVYVPLGTGLIVAYRLDLPTDHSRDEAKTKKKDESPEDKPPTEEERRQNLSIGKKTIPPLFCQSFGHTVVQPLVTRENAKEELVVWPTDRGYLNVGRVDRQTENGLTLKYRLETGAMIVGRPAYLPPDPKVLGDSGLIIATSRDGFVYAFRENDGKPFWRFSIGEPIVESPAVLEGRVYVTAQLGGLHCLAVKTGKELWFAPELFQFVAASKARVYATDRRGWLVALDAQNGARLDALPAEDQTIKVLNSDTDRIYLADETGLIQCLHEVEQSEPIEHDKDRKLAAEVEGTRVVKQRGIGEEKPAKRELTAPKEPAAPKEPRAPKKTMKKKAADAFDAGDANDAFNPPAGAKAGKVRKAVKAKRAKGPAGTGF